MADLPWGMAIAVTATKVFRWIASHHTSGVGEKPKRCAAERRRIEIAKPPAKMIPCAADDARLAAGNVK